MADEGAFDIARKTLYWGISAFILSLLVLGVTLMMLNYKGQMEKTSPLLEANILASRFYSSPKCFAYQDPVTERVYPRLIVLERFKEKNIIDNCYKSGSTKEYQFQMKLKNLDTGDEMVTQTSEWYNVPAFTMIEPVMIQEEDRIYNGQLLIFVQKPI